MSAYDYITIGAAVGAATAVTGILILCCLGCRSRGVRNRSAAASIQGRIGDVVAGSLFAICQSIGAKGCLSKIGVIIAATVIGAVIGFAIWELNKL